MTWATSSGWQTLPEAALVSWAILDSSKRDPNPCSVHRLMMNPGATELTRILGAKARARDWVMLMRAALEAQ